MPEGLTINIEWQYQAQSFLRLGFFFALFAIEQKRKDDASQCFPNRELPSAPVCKCQQNKKTKEVIKVFVIDLSDDNREKLPQEIAEDVRYNKDNNIRFICRCSSCDSGTTVWTKKAKHLCPVHNCGGTLKHIDNRLLEYRTKKNLTQAQLAERWGISKNYVSQMETGYRPISDKYKKRLKV